MEVGGGRLYTYRYTVTIRMTSALRWAAMRAILIFHNCEGQSHKTVSTDHNFWREKRAEADSNRGPAYQPNALPLGRTGSLRNGSEQREIRMKRPDCVVDYRKATWRKVLKSTTKRVNQRSKDVPWIQQQRPETPTELYTGKLVNTRQAIHQLHKRYSI